MHSPKSVVRTWDVQGAWGIAEAGRGPASSLGLGVRYSLLQDTARVRVLVGAVHAPTHAARTKCLANERICDRVQRRDPCHDVHKERIRLGLCRAFRVGVV